MKTFIRLCFVFGALLFLICEFDYRFLIAFYLVNAVLPRFYVNSLLGQVSQSDL